MSTNFPASLDTLTNPTGSDNLGTIAVLHSSQHANGNDAMEAVQAKVGVNGSSVTTSLDYLVAAVNRPFSVVVAASDSDTKIKAKADFPCDGTADEVQLNLAVAALAATGGTIIVAPGTYNLAASWVIDKDSVTVIGGGVGGRQGAASTGRGTFIKAATGVTTAVVLVKQAADVRPLQSVILRDLNVDGNSIGAAVDGIYFSSFEGLVNHCHVHNCTGDGISVQGYGPTPGPQWTTYDTIVSDCHCDHNTLAGVHLQVYAGDVHVLFNVIEDNSTHGIHLQAAGDQIVGGQIYSNTIHGIYLDNSGAQTQIQDVKIENNNQSAIYFDATTTGPSQVMITGCGFRLNCRGANNTYDVIGGTGSGSACTGVLISDCRFNSASGTSTNFPRYGVNLWNATACQQWHVVANQFARNPNHWGTAPINVTGTPSGTKIRANNGAPDWGYMGTATIPSGATKLITVTHNLPFTPAVNDIIVVPTNNPTNDPGNFWIDTFTSTQFNINCRADPGVGGATFAWRVP